MIKQAVVHNTQVPKSDLVTFAIKCECIFMNGITIKNVIASRFEDGIMQHTGDIDTRPSKHQKQQGSGIVFRRKALKILKHLESQSSVFNVND